MNEHLDPSSQRLSSSDKEFERAIRPALFQEFQGQQQVIDNIMVFVHAAKARGEALDHVLLHGPPGLGKTTLSHIIGNEMGVNVRTTSGPVIDKPGDLTYCSSMKSTGSRLWWKSIFTPPWRITR